MRASFQAEVCLRGAALGLALPLLAATRAWRANAGRPVEAIRVGADVAHGSGLA